MTVEIDPIDDRYSAIHEAAHAVAIVVLDLGLDWVNIGNGREADGTMFGGRFHWKGVALDDLIGKREEVVPLIAMYLAGPVAEKKINPNALDPTYESDDREKAQEIAKRAASKAIKKDGQRMFELSPAGKKWLYRRGWGEAIVLVEKHWTTIEALADLLQKRRWLSGDEVEEFVRAAIGSA